MQNLKVTMIQTDLHWEDIDSNLAEFERKIDTVQEETHLIILPEMFTTGFSMNPAHIAQDMEGSAVQWIKNKSEQKNADIAGSIIAKENGKYFNRLIWSKPSGEIFTYDKKHLFRMVGEEKVYSAGDKNITVELNGWRIRPFICYDLRFPAWIRNIGNSYDVAVFIANWPERRSAHWKLLLQARAVENQTYVIGVNRIGKDGNGVPHSGDSSIIDPWGNIIFQEHHKEFNYTTELSYDTLERARTGFPVWMDADNDLILLR